MPNGYSKNHVFEFENGTVKFKHVASTPDDETFVFQLFENVNSTREKVLRALFGHSHISSIRWGQLSLPKNPMKELSKKKLLSLGRKYETIPEQYLLHYPKLTKELDDEIKQEKEDKPKRKRKQKDELGVVKKRRVGRPRKIQPELVPKGHSVMTYSLLLRSES